MDDQNIKIFVQGDNYFIFDVQARLKITLSGRI